MPHQCPSVVSVYHVSVIKKKCHTDIADHCTLYTLVSKHSYKVKYSIIDQTLKKKLTSSGGHEVINICLAPGQYANLNSTCALELYTIDKFFIKQGILQNITVANVKAKKPFSFILRDVEFDEQLRNSSSALYKNLSQFVTHPVSFMVSFMYM